jgi:hypothetical protein
MVRMRFLVGALGIVVGFFVYQDGLFLTLNLSGSLTAWTMTYVPWIASAEILGAALQLIGGLIAIVGLLICISWIGTQSRAVTLPTRARGDAESVKQIPDLAQKCKFCGAAMEPDAAFCPSCQRAQA